MDKTGICQAVVPVAGLLALTARTLRQSEFVALEKLAGVDAGRAEQGDAAAWTGSSARTARCRWTRRPARSCSTGSACSASGCLSRCCAPGSAIRSALADELLERSGLVALRDVIDQQFAQRSELLKAHTALLSLRRFVEVNPIHRDAAHHRRHRPAAGRHPRLRGAAAAVSQLRSRPTTLNDDEMASLRRIIGGSGTDTASRLGLTPEKPYDGPAGGVRGRPTVAPPGRASAQRPVHHAGLPGRGAQRRGDGARSTRRRATDRRLDGARAREQRRQDARPGRGVCVHGLGDRAVSVAPSWSSCSYGGGGRRLGGGRGGRRCLGGGRRRRHRDRSRSGRRRRCFGGDRRDLRVAPRWR